MTRDSASSWEPVYVQPHGEPLRPEALAAWLRQGYDRQRTVAVVETDEPAHAFVAVPRDQVNTARDIYERWQQGDEDNEPSGRLYGMLTEAEWGMPFPGIIVKGDGGIEAADEDDDSDAGALRALRSDVEQIDERLRDVQRRLDRLVFDAHRTPA